MTRFIETDEIKDKLRDIFDNPTVNDALQVILETSDASGDGRISPEEFHQALRLGYDGTSTNTLLVIVSLVV
jgi:hypothetical protein